MSLAHMNDIGNLSPWKFSPISTVSQVGIFTSVPRNGTFHWMSPDRNFHFVQHLAFYISDYRKSSRIQVEQVHEASPDDGLGTGRAYMMAHYTGDFPLRPFSIRFSFLPSQTVRSMWTVSGSECSQCLSHFDYCEPWIVDRKEIPWPLVDNNNIPLCYLRTRSLLLLWIGLVLCSSITFLYVLNTRCVMDPSLFRARAM